MSSFLFTEIESQLIFFQNQSQNDVHKSSEWHYKQKRSEFYPILFLTKKMKFIMFCRNKSTASYYSFTKGKEYCVFFNFFFSAYIHSQWIASMDPNRGQRFSNGLSFEERSFFVMKKKKDLFVHFKQKTLSPVENFTAESNIRISSI